MDNAQTQSMVAYEDAPKEVNHKRGLHDGNKQFGKKKMPQDEKQATRVYVKEKIAGHEMKMHHGRHKEHR